MLTWGKHCTLASSPPRNQTIYLSEMITEYYTPATYTARQYFQSNHTHNLTYYLFLLSCTVLQETRSLSLETQGTKWGNPGCGASSSQGIQACTNSLKLQALV